MTKIKRSESLVILHAKIKNIYHYVEKCIQQLHNLQLSQYSNHLVHIISSESLPDFSFLMEELITDKVFNNNNKKTENNNKTKITLI